MAVLFDVNFDQSNALLKEVWLRIGNPTVVERTSIFFIKKIKIKFNSYFSLFFGILNKIWSLNPTSSQLGWP